MCGHETTVLEWSPDGETIVTVGIFGREILFWDATTGEPKEIATKAGVYVGGATDFDAAFSGSSNGESTFSISNIGSVSASSVTVRIPDQEGWKVMGSNSVIIGFSVSLTGADAQAINEEKNTAQIKITMNFFMVPSKDVLLFTLS